MPMQLVMLLAQKNATPTIPTKIAVASIKSL